jgi:hypothetical protein
MAPIAEAMKDSLPLLNLIFQPLLKKGKTG